MGIDSLDTTYIQYVPFFNDNIPPVSVDSVLRPHAGGAPPVTVSTDQSELAPQSPPEQSWLLATKLEVKLQRPTVVDEEGVSLSDLAVVVEVEPGNVIAMDYKAGVNVDRGLSRSSTLWVQF